jgi:hypothetical protein
MTLRDDAEMHDRQAERSRGLVAESRQVGERVAAVPEDDPWTVAADGKAHESILAAATHLAEVPTWHHEPIRLDCCGVGARLRRGDDDLGIEATLTGLSAYAVVRQFDIPRLAMALRGLVKAVKTLPEQLVATEASAGVVGGGMLLDP